MATPNELEGKFEKASPLETKPPTHNEVAARAHQIWLEQGCPEGCAEEHWLEAERQLHDAVLSKKLLQIAHDHGGSVQS